MERAAFAADWGALLERLGEHLYRRAAPALGTLVAVPDDDGVAFPAAVAERRLVVGWRTWYGPAYVERYGRDWLLGLPDRAAPLEAGGVRHALAAPAPALVAGDPAVYAPLWPYLERAGVTPAWPKRPGAPRQCRMQQTDV